MRIFATIFFLLALSSGHPSHAEINASKCNFDVDADYGTNVHGTYTIAVSSHIGGDVSQAEKRGLTTQSVQKTAEQRLINNHFPSVMGQAGWVPMNEFAHLWVEVSVVALSRSPMFFYNIDVEFTRTLKCKGFAEGFDVDVRIWGSSTFGLDRIMDMNQSVTENVHRLVDEFIIEYFRSAS